MGFLRDLGPGRRCQRARPLPEPELRGRFDRRNGLLLPGAGRPKFFDFDDNGEGAHYLEPFLQISGPETAPFTLFAGFFAYNDPDNSIYLEGQFPFVVNGVEMGLTVGVVAGESGFYNTGSVALVNLGLSASRTIQITESFGLPVFVRYILNPNPRVERSYLVFGFSL